MLQRRLPAPPGCAALFRSQPGLARERALLIIWPNNVEAEKELAAGGFTDISIAGGGFMNHKPDRKELFIHGESKAFGRPPQATVEKIRRAAVEIQIRGQLREGGALVRNRDGKILVVAATQLFLDPRGSCMMIAENN